MYTVPNIALVTECRLLGDSSAINLSLERQEKLDVSDRVQVPIEKV